ncbi:MAG: SIMPL domain-containing protein [Patescibacteria group bacterium]
MEKTNYIVASAIIGASLIIGVLIHSVNLIKINKMGNTLGVTGSATITVDSDLAKLKASFSRSITESNLKSGYAQMKMDEAKVAKFLKDNGLTEEEYEISPVSMYEEYNYYKDMNIEVEKKYNLTQQVTITSNDIEKVQKLSKKTEDLINMDVLYQSNNPEYYYTKLPDTRINLLPEAVADAQKRAEAIAKSTSRKVDTLESADMGVVQVREPNSVDVAEYGMYDTATIQKEIMITVRANFILN